MGDLTKSSNFGGVIFLLFTSFLKTSSRNTIKLRALAVALSCQRVCTRCLLFLFRFLRRLLECDLANTGSGWNNHHIAVYICGDVPDHETEDYTYMVQKLLEKLFLL